MQQKVLCLNLNFLLFLIKTFSYRLKKKKKIGAKKVTNKKKEMKSKCIQLFTNKLWLHCTHYNWWTSVITWMEKKKKIMMNFLAIRVFGVQYTFLIFTSGSKIAHVALKNKWETLKCCKIPFLCKLCILESYVYSVPTFIDTICSQTRKSL